MLGWYSTEVFIFFLFSCKLKLCLRIKRTIVITKNRMDFNFIHERWRVFKYRKIPIMSPGLVYVQRAGFILLGLFRESLFSDGLVVGRNLLFKLGLACQ